MFIPQFPTAEETRVSVVETPSANSILDTSQFGGVVGGTISTDEEHVCPPLSGFSFQLPAPTEDHGSLPLL